MQDESGRRKGGPSRRHVLKALGAGAAVGLAGCESEPDPGGGGSGTDAPSPSSSGSGTPTGTPTQSGSRQTAGVGACGVSDPADRDGTETGGKIEEDTTLGADADAYRVTKTLRVENGATLTVAPGTTLAFDADTNLVVANGALDAVGTCEDPILFTGGETTPGYWGYVSFEGVDTDNHLAYAVVEYAGGRKPWVAEKKAAVSLVDGCRARIEHSTIRESEHFGVEVTNDSTLDAFAFNAVTANGEAPARVNVDTAHYLADTSSYTGNELDYISVNERGHGIASDAAVTWDGLNVPYRTQSVTVNGDLTIAPGASLEFTEDARLTVHSKGSLTAAGTATDPITFTAPVDERGHWAGIAIDGSGAENELAHAVVEYAGSSKFVWAEARAGVAVLEGGTLSIRDCTIRDTDGYGLEVTNESGVPEFANNTLTANADGAARVDVHTLDLLTTDSEYTGNDADRVFVNDRGIGIGSDDAVTWHDLGVPLDVRGVSVEGVLTVDPGVRMRFDEDTGITVGADGRLLVEGDPENEVVCTGQEETPGHWNGITFDGSQDSTVENAVVSYAGGEFVWAGEPAAVTVVEASVTSLGGVEITDTEGYGLYLGQDSETPERDVEFARNTMGTVYDEKIRGGE